MQQQQNTNQIPKPERAEDMNMDKQLEAIRRQWLTHFDEPEVPRLGATTKHGQGQAAEGRGHCTNQKLPCAGAQGIHAGTTSSRLQTGVVAEMIGFVQNEQAGFRPAASYNPRQDFQKATIVGDVITRRM